MAQDGPNSAAVGVREGDVLAGKYRVERVLGVGGIKVTNDPAPAMRGLRPDVPVALETIVFKCLEKDRRQRYRNVAELALALLPFAPKRAKGSVERISGIIHAAGLSASALAVPVSPQTAATRVPRGDSAALRADERRLHTDD